jgi:hypothetical protein
MFRLAMLVAAGIGGPIPGPATATAAAVRAPVPVVTFCEVDCNTYNVGPGQRLDMVMNGGGTLDEIRTRCDDMGGDDLVSVPWSDVLLVCEGIDF